MITETSGICQNCNHGYHEKCENVIARGDTGPIFCTCYCTGDTSFGNILYKEPIPVDIKDEFKQKFPEHGRKDPLDKIL